MAVGDNVLLGLNSTIGLSEETTFGTKVDSFSYIEFNSESFKREREERKLEAINGSRDFIKRLLLNETISGSMEVDFNPASDAVVYLIKQALGGTVSSSENTGGSGTTTGGYTHTLNVGDMESNAGTSTATDVKSLSAQVSKGGRVWDFVGLRVNTLTIKGEVGSQLTVSAELMGKTASITSSTPTAVFSDVIPINFTGITFETGDSLTNLSSEKIQSFELTINNNLAENRQLGDRTICNLPALRREVMLKVSQNFDTTTAHNIFLAETATAIRITMDSEQTMTSSTGSGNYQAQIDLPRSFYNSNQPEVGGFDILSHDLEISAIGNNTTTAFAVQMQVQNLTTDYE